MLATRRPLDPIGMNTVAGSPRTRRSVRLSADLPDDNDAPRKRPQDDAATTTSKRGKRKKDYDQESDGFVFTKSKKLKPTKDDAAQSSEAKNGAAVNATSTEPDTTTTKPTSHRQRKQLPTTPERQSPARTVKKLAAAPVPREKSPFKAAHAESHARAERSVSPAKAITVEKKRRKKADAQDTTTSRIMLPTSDTPIIRRNKAIRQSIANGDRRRSSSDFRGKRVSSMMDDGRWNAIPHSSVVASEFYTIISPDLTEPRRMRLLLGWCGDRALPAKPQAPSSTSKEASEDLQADLAARTIQEELSKELSSNGSLSEWFSRDMDAPPPKVVLRKKPNPRNIANAAKAEELERELERLRQERKAWEDVMISAEALPAQSNPAALGELSPIHPDDLPTPQRALFEQLSQSQELSTDPGKLQKRLEDVASKLEFTIDSFAHSVHALSTTRDLAERAAQQATSDAAQILDKREQDQLARSGGRKVDALDALRGLAKALNRPR